MAIEQLGCPKGSWSSFCALGRSGFIPFLLGSSLFGAGLMLFQMLTMPYEVNYGNQAKLHF